MERDKKIVRCMNGQLKTRAEPEGIKAIEGYFVVFDTETELCPGCYEKILKEAVTETLDKDVRALINHDSTLVMGRNKANTLYLTVDEHGLFGKIVINENDSDAMNLYERVKRGDVSQCSFGFFILDEESECRQDGSVLWIIKKIELFEVSVCTFPAYGQTEVTARSREREEMLKRKLKTEKVKLKERLKNGFKTDYAE